MAKTEYIPFGKEWEKEVNKYPKVALIKMLRKSLMENNAAPKMYEKLKEAQDMICRLKLSMMAHPDCTEGSEFDDYTISAQEIEDSITDILIESEGGIR